MVSVGQDASPVLWSIPLDGKSEPVKLPSLRYDGAQGLSTMPDGRIVFTAVVRDEPQVWVMNADGTERRVLTRDGASASPAPAPDGSFIAFAGSRDNRIGIYRINPDGSGERQVALVPNARSLGVSPDGRWITFTAAIGGPASLWRVASDGGAPELVAANMDRSSLSPDGTQIIGVRTEGPRYGVALMPVAGGPATWVPAPAAAGTGEGIYRFAADGQSVYFTTSERTNLWSWRPGADAAVKVTNFSDSSIVTGALSANGRAMLVSRGPVTQDAFLIRNFR
jgi:Tol biopolymer transport system component